MAQLYTSSVGTITLWAEIDGAKKRYVCTSLLMNMRLNALPTASVVIGCGSSIRYGHLDDSDNNAEDLLACVKNNISKGSNFINCEICEEQLDWKQTIFKGCIVAASLVYKTGNPTIRAVRLECMNAACQLYCQPFGAYTNRASADVVTKILAHVPISSDSGQNIARMDMSRLSSLDPRVICSTLRPMIGNKDIATKIAYIIDALSVLTQHTINTAKLKDAGLGNILHIQDYIKSDYVLNYKKLAINNQTDTDYNMSLCARFISTLETGSILDAILGAIMSTDYMLTLVPTWVDKGFAMEIKPSMAWESGNTSYIGFSSISDMNSSYNPLSHINDPEVFAVDFTPAIEFDGTNAPKGSPGSAMVGVYSTVPEVMEWARIRFSDSSIELPKRIELTKNMMHYKWREFAAPIWLKNSIIRTKQGTDEKDEQSSTIEDRRTWPKESSRNKEDPIVRDYQAGYSIADTIAKALYVHIHGASSTAQVTLLPLCRFGFLPNGFTFEQHIGELIDILPLDAQDKPLGMRGMIEGIQFEYNAGQSASCKYSMTLSRVRPYDANEKAVPCPVYVRAY